MAGIKLQLSVTESGVRADLAIARALKGATSLSRAQIKSALEAGTLLLNDRKVSPAQLLEPGSYELTSQGELEPPHARPGTLILPIAYEDSELLVIDKPSGLPSVPHASDEIETAVSFALAHCPELVGIGKSSLEPGLLHRLDTGTSGLLAFAKTEAAFDRLRKAWSTGKVRKSYRAIVTGRVPEAATTYQLDLAHDAKSAKRMRVYEEGKTRLSQIRGKPLPTVTVIEQIHATREGQSDIEVRIQTGVLHQIRCTLAHLGAPIVGDALYGEREAPRLWLHAWKLDIPGASHKSGDIEIVSQLPSDWPL